MKKTSVPLVIAFTPDYFIPAATCLYSIITSMQAEGELHVICLLSEELPERLKLKIQLIGEGRTCCESSRKIAAYIY